MQKILLKPFAQEINYKPSEPNTFFDAFEYSAHEEKNKHLGHLYVIGQVKYSEENMDYVLNLIASLAKREYYSENNGSPAENPKKALDSALKKLNGVLDDFFKNKDLKLNIGLLALAGENIYLAKLGKFKVLLARNGELIDILNNVNLFQKEHVQEKQFVNIISGRLFEGDKIFALYPTRQTTLKEKLLKSFLVKHGQEEFLADLASLGKQTKNFQSCGFHIEIKKIKEDDITIKSAYQKSKVILASIPDAPAPEMPIPAVKSTLPPEKSSESVPENLKEPPQPEENVGTGPAKIISAEMSLIKRKSIFSKLAELFSRRLFFLGKKAAPVLFLLIILGGGFLLARRFVFPRFSQEAGALKTAEEKVRLAETQITKNENSSARELLALSLSSLTSAKETNKKVVELRARINALIDRLDLVNPRQPELWLDANANILTKIIPTDAEQVWAINAEKKVVKLKSENTAGVTAAVEAKYIFSSPEHISIFDGTDKVAVIDTKNGKPSTFALKEATPLKAAAVYENNLYLLGDNSIYKYSDGAVKEGAKKQSWFSGLADQDTRGIAADGNIYVLTGSGTVIKYFRSQEAGRITLNPAASSEAEFYTEKDSPYLYLSDTSSQKIRLYDKSSGALVVTFKFGSLPALKHLAIKQQTAYALSGDNKVWKISLVP